MKGGWEGACLAGPGDRGGGVLAGGSLERTCPGLSDEVLSSSPAQSDFPDQLLLNRCAKCF